MKEFLIAAVTLSLTISVICAVIPEGKNGEIKKYTVYICTLCMISLMIKPVTDIFAFLSELREGNIIVEYNDYSSSEEKYKEFFSGVGEDTIKVELRRMICERFGISEENCHIGISTHNEDCGMVIDKVTVILSGKAVFSDPYKIEEYVTNILGCECYVTA